MIDVTHPFFRPRWRRVLIVLLTAGWSGVEFYNGAPLWAAFFVAVAAYCAWAFFLSPEGRALDKDS